MGKWHLWKNSHTSRHGRGPVWWCTPDTQLSSPSKKTLKGKDGQRLTLATDKTQSTEQWNTASLIFSPLKHWGQVLALQLSGLALNLEKSGLKHGETILPYVEDLWVHINFQMEEITSNIQTSLPFSVVHTGLRSDWYGTMRPPPPECVSSLSVAVREYQWLHTLYIQYV